MTMIPPRPIAILALALLVLAAAALMSGCAGVELQHPDGWKGRYGRVGSQDLQGVKAELTKDGTFSVSVESAKSDATDLIKATTEMIQSAR